MTENNRNNTLILESGYSGHRSEYIIHIMQFINEQPNLYGKYVFILNEQIVTLLGDLAASENYYIKCFEFDRDYRNSISRSFYEWQLIAEWIDAHDRTVNEIIFMSVDEYLILITTKRFKKYQLSVKGILFQPYVHYKGTVGDRNLIKNYVLQRYAAFLNSEINQLYILNDKQAVERMNLNIKNIYAYLPDPIESSPNIMDASIHEEVASNYGLDQKKKILLMFGMIDDRKNLINIIDALRLLPDEIKESVHLLVIGKLNKAVRDKYLSYISNHKHEVNITFNDTFVSEEEREVLFTYCDIVLMPYINFYSSSGILGHAIKHQKSIVASNKGLVGRVVKENNLGLAVDPLKPEEIKSAICQLINNFEGYQYESALYLREHSPINFSKTLLSFNYQS